MNFWSELPRPILGLAPMDGVTDAAFRRMVAEQGVPDVMFTEFTHVGDISRGPEYLLEALRYSELERPIVAQIYGKDPMLFYQAAHVVCELGFDGLDINMGCPSKNVASSGSGAALINTPGLARDILRAVKQGIHDWAAGQTLEAAGLKRSRCQAITRMNEARTQASAVPRRVIPWSVKTRLGCDHIVIDEWMQHLLEERPAAITIHGRTLAQMYRGEADWGAIAAAADKARDTETLIIGNGDVRSMPEALRRAEESRVDGVLIGRATLGAPWFFRAKTQVRSTDRFNGLADELPASPTTRERFAIMLAHARQFESLYGGTHFCRMRKHLGWYCKGFARAAAMRARLFHATSAHDVEGIIGEFFGDAFLPLLQGSACCP